MTDERCNADLGPLTAKLLEQQREIARLTAERDEARRFMCCFQVMRTKVPKPMSFDPAEAREYANQKGWDCFKEDGK